MKETFGNGSPSTQVENKDENERTKRDKSYEMLSSMPAELKFGLIVLAVGTGSLISANVGKRIVDYKDLKQAQELVDKKLQKSSAEREKIKEQIGVNVEKLKVLLGEEYLKKIPGYAEYAIGEDELLGYKEDLLKKQKDFSYFRPADFFEREKYLPEEIKNEEVKESPKEAMKDVVAHDLISDNNKDTLPADAFIAIMNQTYPQGFIMGEVAQVRQENIKVELGEDYGEIKNGESWASCSGGSGNSSSVITFYSPSYNSSMLENINGAFSHEVAHANDWMANSNLSLFERINFLVSVINRVRSEDRYRSSYVESIKNSKNKKLELSLKAEEYWAEICGTYIGGAVQNLNYKDVKVVEKIIKKKDKNFDRNKAYQKRLNSIYSYGYKQNPVNYYHNKGGVAKI